MKVLLIASIFTQLQITLQAFGKHYLPTSRPIREVCWQSGDQDVMVLNVDGSAVINPGQSGFGGLVRNQEGNFYFGFYESIGWSNMLHVEIQALLIGIKLCWQAGFKKVICFSDSLHVVKLVAMGTH